MRSRYWLAGILAVLALGLAACGGSDGGDEAPEPTATTATEQPTVEAPPTPLSTPTITGNLFEYEEKGYSVRFPEGWTPRPNFLPAPGFAVDAFFGPEEIRGVQPNIAVTCETPPEDMELREYFDAKVDIVRQVAQVEPEVSSLEISGQEAFLSRFAREDSDPPLEKSEVIFITERCGWSIAMTVPLGDEAAYQDVFDEFLESFRVLP